MGKQAGVKKTAKAVQAKAATGRKGEAQAKTRPIGKSAKVSVKKVVKAPLKPAKKVVAAKKVVPAKKAAPAKPLKKTVRAKPARVALPPKAAKTNDKTLTTLRAPKPPKAKAAGPKGYTPAEY